MESATGVKLRRSRLASQEDLALWTQERKDKGKSDDVESRQLEGVVGGRVIELQICGW